MRQITNQKRDFLHFKNCPDRAQTLDLTSLVLKALQLVPRPKSFHKPSISCIKGIPGNTGAGGGGGEPCDYITSRYSGTCPGIPDRNLLISGFSYQLTSGQPKRGGDFGVG